MTIITDQNKSCEIHLDGSIEVPLLAQKLPIDTVKEQPCHDLLCDQLRELLIDKGIFDEKGVFNQELLDQELPDIDAEAVQKLKHLFQSHFDLILSDRSCVVKLPLSFIPDIVNRYLNKKHVAESELVGGIVSYILGTIYYSKALETLGIDHADSFIDEDIQKSIDSMPPDIDLRTICEALTSVDLDNIEARVIHYLSRSIFRGVNRKTCSEINAKAFLKKKHYIDLNNDYLIITFGNRSTYSIDNLVISKMERDQLFSRDALKIPCPVDFSAKNISSKTVKPTSSWLHGWPAIISKLTKTISVKDPESVNYFGWVMLLSYMSRGYCSLDDGSNVILRGTLVDHLLKDSDRPRAFAGLVNKTVGDHHYNDFVSSCFIHLNASSELGKIFTDNDWKKVIGHSEEYCSSSHLANNLMSLWYMYQKALDKNRVKPLISAEITNFQSVVHSEELVGAIADTLYLPYQPGDGQAQLQDRCLKVQELLKKHEKKNNSWIESFLEVLKHKDVPVEVTKALLVIAGSQHFSRAFDNQRESEYVLRRHCGEEYLQVRVRNQGKLHTLLLPYDHKKSLAVVSEFLKQNKSESGHLALSKFWGLLNNGVVYEGQSTSRLHYLDKAIGGAIPEKPIDFGNSSLGLSVKIQQTILQLSQTGDKRLLLDLYSLVPEYFSSADESPHKKQLYTQLYSAIQLCCEGSDCSTLEKLLKAKTCSQMKGIWLQMLMDTDDGSQLSSILKSIKCDYETLSSTNHKNLFDSATNKKVYQSHPTMIEWLDFLSDKQIIQITQRIEMFEKLVSRMGGRVNLQFIVDAAKFAKGLCSYKWKGSKSRKACFSDHPAYNVVIQLSEWLIDHGYSRQASEVMVNLPKGRLSSADKSLRILWMQVLSDLVSDKFVDLKVAAEHWEEGVRRNIVNLRFLNKDELALVISFGSQLLQSDGERYQKLGCEIAKELHKKKVPNDLLEIFSLLYTEYYEYLLKDNSVKDIEYTMKTLKNGSLSRDSIEKIEDKQYKYLLRENQFDKALVLLSKFYSRSTPGLHRSKLEAFLNQLLSREKLSKQEQAKTFSLIKSLFSPKHKELGEDLKISEHTHQVLAFIQSYIESSESHLNRQNSTFFLCVVEVLYSEGEMTQSAKTDAIVSHILKTLLSNVSGGLYQITGKKKQAIKRLMKNLMKSGSHKQVIELLHMMNVHKMISPGDEEFMYWIIELTDQQILKDVPDKHTLSLCLQLSKSLLTHYVSTDVKLSGSQVRISKKMISQCIDEDNMKAMHAWAGKLTKLIEIFDDLDVSEFEKEAKLWVNRLKRNDHIDDATQILKAFEGEDLSAGLPVTVSLIKALVEKKQYIKALELLRPYKKKDLKDCEELKPCIQEIIDHLLKNKIGVKTYPLLHQALVKTECLDLSIWSLYLDQCLNSQSKEIMERGKNGFVNVFRNNRVKTKTMAYKVCYAKVVQITCMSTPEKAIDWVSSMEAIWKVLSGEKAKDLRREVTKTILLTSKSYLQNKEHINAKLLSNLIALFNSDDYVALFKEDMVTKSLLELSVISVFFRINNQKILMAVVNWFMGYPLEYGRIELTDEHFAVYNDIIDSVVNTKTIVLATYLQLYDHIFSLIKQTKSKKIHTLKFFVHCLAHENPIIQHLASYELTQQFPHIVECMKTFSDEMEHKDLELSVKKKKKKTKAIDSPPIKNYSNTFEVFSVFLLNAGAYSLLAQFIENEDVIHLVPPEVITGVKKKIINQILTDALFNKDKGSIDRAINYYCEHHLDVPNDMTFHLSCLDKIFDMSILYLTHHKRYGDFINAIRNVISCVYKEDRFKEFSFFNMIRAAYGPKIQAPKGVKDDLAKYPIVGNVLLLNEKQIFYKSAIMLIQKLLSAKSDDEHSKYLQLTVSYMILSQVLANKRRGTEDLLNCLQSFFLTDLPLNDVALYANHLSRCLGLICTVQQSGMLYHLPDVYANLCMTLAAPHELKKMVKRENIKFYRDKMVEHIKRVASQNTYTSFKTAFRMYYQSFPVLFKDLPEYQRKAFHYILESLKVKPLEKHPHTTAFDRIFSHLSIDQHVIGKEFLMKDISGEFGLYQDVLCAQSREAFEIPLSSKIEFAYQMLKINKFRFSSHYDPVDVTVDPSVIFMYAKTVSEVISRDLTEANYDIYESLFEEVSCDVIGLLKKKKIEGKSLGLCMTAINTLSIASIQLYLSEGRPITIKRVCQMIKGYSKLANSQIAGHILVKWAEAISETKNAKLISTARGEILDTAKEMNLDKNAKEYIDKIQNMLSIVG